MLVWVSFILDPKHLLSDADPESYFNLSVVPPGYQPKGEGDCRFRGAVCPGILRASGAHSPWSAAHLGEGNSDNEPTGRGSSSALVSCPPRRGEL